MGNIFNEAEYVADKYQTRDPYKLLDAIGAIVKYEYDYQPDGLKGFAAIIKRVMFCVINGNLTEHERRIVAGHEAAHLILHRKEILQSPAKALKDFDLFNNSGRLEHQANSFLADFLVSDIEAMDAIIHAESDYFTTARELNMPPHLLAFKLYSMMHRGYSVRNPVGLDSKFLGREDW